MINNPKYVTDGFSTLLGGADESRAPLLLGPNQVSRAINLTFRGGFMRVRPGFNRKALRFQRGEYAQWYYTHRFQGAEYFDDLRGMEKKVASVGGRIFLIDPTNNFLVTDITPRRTTVTTAAFTAQDPLTDIAITVSDSTLIFSGYPIYINGKEYSVISMSGGILTARNIEDADGTVVASGATVEYLDPNSPNQPLAWFVQAEQYLIVQDDQSRPIIFDGASSRRTANSGEIPTGSAMAYGRGRVWVAVNNGREFVAGDIAGGPTGVLGFTENTYLSGGGSFRIGANVGRIRAMSFVMNLDTSLGQGPLQVLADRAIYSVNAPTQRELWSVIRDPIQTESLINFGATGQYSTVLVNGDLFFRAEDGLRSFFISRRDFGTWGNTPISREMNRLLDADTPELLLHSGSVLWDNRLLFTTSPAPSDAGVYHRGLIALDFDLISTLKGKEPPAYDGLWTGMKITGLVAGRFSGRNRCFAFAHSEDGRNELWEITRNGRFDNDVNQIEGVLETRSMNFPMQGAPSGLKRLNGAEVNVADFARESFITLRYKSDQNPCWQYWDTKSICITDDQCDETDPCASTTTGNMHGYKTRLSFGLPPDVDNAVDEKAMRFGFSFQVRMEIVGYVEISLFKAYAHVEEEWAQAPPSDSRSVCNAVACCPPDPFEYVADCGALDAPVAAWYTDAAPFGEYNISFYTVTGRSYTYYHASSAVSSSIATFTATMTGWTTIPVTRIASIGATERVWYSVAASGDCVARTSPESELTIVY